MQLTGTCPASWFTMSAVDTVLEDVLGYIFTRTTIWAGGQKIYPPGQRRHLCFFSFVIMILSSVNNELCLTFSLWRKVQELGLARAYMHNRRVKRLIRKVRVIGHLPLVVVRMSFITLQNDAHTRYSQLSPYVARMHVTHPLYAYSSSKQIWFLHVIY